MSEESKESKDSRERRKNPLILHVFDDKSPDTLTQSDIEELKWLAKQSRSVKWVMAGIIGVCAFFGLDHIRDFIKNIRHW